MKDIVIVDAVRSPMGRSKGGMYRHRRAEHIGADVLKALLERNPALNPKEIDDVLWGCVQQTREQAYNIARFISLQGKVPASVSAQTINRNCGSSLSALNLAATSILAEQGEVYIVGGVEHMGHVPMNHGVDLDPHASRYYAKAANMMGLTAELLAKQHQISREMQDRFALNSHQNAFAATQEGLFRDEIVPLLGHEADGSLKSFDYDEIIRNDADFNTLSKLRPVFDPQNGTVTAGNASAIADGASALLVMEASKAKTLGAKPLARVIGMASAGVEPSIMGYGPVPAVHKALKRCQLGVPDVDTWELNEAFAAQSLAVLSGLGILKDYEERVNMHGGAIALGHPLGCSGARITTTLLHHMKRSEKRRIGVATMCIGGGQGIATVFESLCPS